MQHPTGPDPNEDPLVAQRVRSCSVVGAIDTAGRHSDEDVPSATATKVADLEGDAQRAIG